MEYSNISTVQILLMLVKLNKSTKDLAKVNTTRYNDLLYGLQQFAPLKKHE